MKTAVGTESWVTFVTTDTEAWRALILVESIRKTCTTKCLTVLTSNQISQKFTPLFEKYFDLVYSFDPNEIQNGVLTKIWIWNLNFKKCIYLNPTVFMVQNSDELFLKDPIEFKDYLKKLKLKQIEPFVFSPNKGSFPTFAETVENYNSDGLICQDFMNSAEEKLTILHKDKMNNPKIADVTESLQLDIRQKTKLGISDDFCDIHFVTLVHEILAELLKVCDKDGRKFLLNWANFIGVQHLDNEQPSFDAKEPTTVSNQSTFKKLKVSESENKYSNSIAVVGMSCRFPNANTVDEFWDVLVNGIDSVSTVPSNRPDLHEYMSKFQAGFLKCPIDEFDAKFFGISPREALFMDPQQRLLLEVIWESLEHANINPKNLYGSNTGVYLGIWQQPYEKNFPTSTINANDFQHRYVGNVYSATAARISFVLGLYGPNIAIESGCSSSLAAIHLACEALRHRTVNSSIAAGVNLVLSGICPLADIGDASDAFVISKTFRCRTFDESADGFVRAEGVGSVILKRYEDAIEDGDNILGIIRGSALNNDGPRGSMGTPNANSQVRVFTEALKVAGVHPKEVSNIEAHGTGTKIGDPIEISSIERVYSANRTEPLIISSLKTIIGHSEACCGIAGLIRVMLSFKHKTIPRQLHFLKLNPYINLDDIPARLALETLPWNNEKRIAAVNSFGYSGTNVHLIVQEPPPLKVNQGNDSKLQVCTISAKSDTALEALRLKYIEFMKNNLNTSLNEISYCLNTGRAQFPYRISFVANNSSTFLQKLESKTYFSNRQILQTPKIVFLFTGQGSQYFNMGKILYESNDAFKNAIDECDSLFENNLQVSLKSILWDSNNENLLDSTIYCQPAIFSIEYALLELWRSFGIQPSVVTGHSVGEFGACVAAGVLSLKDAMHLLVGRSKLVNSLENGSMYAVKQSISKVNQLIEEFTEKNKGAWIDIAAVNSEEEVVISGLKSNADLFSKFISDKGVKNQQVKAFHAFHSRQMDTITASFRKVAASIKLNKPCCTYFSATLSKELKEAKDFNEDYWTKHIRETVQFYSTSKATSDTGGKVYVEIGSQPTLLALTIANISNSNECTFCPSLRKTEHELNTFLTSVSKLFTNGVDIDFSSWYGKMTKTVQLPNYPFQRQSFWFHKEGKINENPLLHPLLGRLIKLPISDTIFRNTIDVEEISFLKNHQINGKIIFPGAGFLEIILQAGLEVLQTGSLKLPIAIEDFRIDSPLLLEKPVEIQTVVRSETKAIQEAKDFRFNIQLYKLNENSKWTRNSQAKFIPSYSSNTQSTTISEGLSSLKGRLTNHCNTLNIYSEGIDKHIQFTGKFRSISEAWSSEKEILALVNLPEEESAINTILFDSMFQAFYYRKKISQPHKDKKLKLKLPTAIRRFIWFPSTPVTENVYVYINLENDGDNINVSLYSEDEKIIARMDGIELIKTNPTLFIKHLNSETKILPIFFKEIWKLWKYQPNERIDTNLLKIALANEFVDERLSVLKEEEHKFDKTDETIQNIFLLYFIRGLQEAGWTYGKIGNILDINDWEQIRPQKLKQMDFNIFGKLLEIDGYLSETKDLGKYQILKDLPKISECETLINKKLEYVEQIEGESDVYYLFTKRCGKLMTKLLQGKITPVQYLFPEDKNEVGAIRFFNESKNYVNGNRVFVSRMMETITGLPRNKNDKILRILEIGAGSGVTANTVISQLTKYGIKHRYVFTDISQAFFINAAKILPTEVEYQIFDIDQDPLKQGFAPEQFDLIIAANVIHVSRNIKKAILNLKTLLSPGGFVIFSEQLSQFKNVSCLTFGFLDGWWKFSDERKLSPLLDEQSWKNAFQICGYDNFHSITTNINEFMCAISRKPKTEILQVSQTNILKNEDDKRNRWIFYNDEFCSKNLKESLITNFKENGREIYKNLETVEEDLSCIEGILYFWCNEISNEPFFVQQESCFKFLQICRQLIEKYKNIEAKPKIVVITKGVYYIGDSTVGDPNRASIVGMLRSFSNEQPNFPLHIIDTNQNYENEENLSKEIFSLIWMGGKEQSFAIRYNQIYYQRLVFPNEISTCINLPNTDRFALVNPPSSTFSDIKINPVPKMEISGSNVEIRVHACSMNFRDLFYILKPEGFVFNEKTTKEPGFDIAGTVVGIGPNVTKLKIGDEVFGLNACIYGGGFASHVITNEIDVLKKKPHTSFQAASTISLGYVTSYYSFNIVANIQKGQKVLIHTATGGVGLAAIEIAKHIGCQIFATAGSHRKRAYLKNIGIKYIYHSRNTDFGDQILKDTNGEGIDIVLNSLTAPNFKEASLKVVKDRGHFLEIGKLNIWTKEEVFVLRPNVNYTIVDMMDITLNHQKTYQSVFNRIKHGYEQGFYKPLPYRNFQLENIKDAFYYFQKAKHIGKIVISIPNSKLNPEGKLEHKLNIFNKESSYLITGGLGGIGIEVLKWMTQVGAQNIILTSRNQPNPQAKKCIDEIVEKGYKVIVLNCDVGNFDEVKLLLKKIKEVDVPPLRGIMHAAGILSDGLIQDQTVEKYKLLFNPKIYGTWNLHELTKNYDLEFFTCFSTMTCIIGTPGQSNHAAANRFMDAFAHFRIAQGLPASTMNFGPWASVGVVANSRIGIDGGFGVAPLLPKQGIAAIEKIFKESIKQVSVTEIKDLNLVKQLLHLGNFFEELTTIDVQSEAEYEEKIAKLIENIKNADKDKRLEKAEIFLEFVVKITLRIPEQDELDPNEPLSSFGVDSLMAMEIRQIILPLVGENNLKLSEMQHYKTIHALAEYITSVLEKNAV